MLLTTAKLSFLSLTPIATAPLPAAQHLAIVSQPLAQARSVTTQLRSSIADRYPSAAATGAIITRRSPSTTTNASPSSSDSQ